METPNPQEEKKEEPKPEYNEDTAILKSGLLIALVNTDKGPAIFSSMKDREVIIMAKGEIDAYLNFILIKGALNAEAMRRKITQPQGGIMNFVKGGKRF